MEILTVESYFIVIGMHSYVCHRKKTYFVLHIVVEIPTPVLHSAIRTSEISNQIASS